MAAAAAAADDDDDDDHDHDHDDDDDKLMLVAMLMFMLWSCTSLMTASWMVPVACLQIFLGCYPAVASPAVQPDCEFLLIGPGKCTGGLFRW